MNDRAAQRERLEFDRALLKRFKAGDRSAFAELYRAYSARLYRQILYPCLGNQSAAEDALAETFRTAYGKLADFELRDVSVYHWLARIAKNKALDMHRAQKVTGRVLSNFQTLLGPLGPQPDSPDDLLENAVEAERVKERVATVLGKLNERYQRAIELRFLKDCSRQECAELLEVKVATFDVLLLRALRSFRKHWESLQETHDTTPCPSQTGAL